MPEITLRDWIENWATVQPIETYRMRMAPRSYPDAETERRCYDRS